MRRTRKCLLALMMIVSIFGSSCSSLSGRPAENGFSLTILEPETEIKAGDQVSFTARLSNLTNQDHVLTHGMPLIMLSMQPVGAEIEEGFGATLKQTILKAHQYTEEKLDVSEAETGDYILKAYCVFDINGKEYRYECEELPIKVTGEQTATKLAR